MVWYSTNSDIFAVLSCPASSPSNPSNSIILHFYCLAIASTELCELVLHGSYVESQSQIYMFKDPFSPDHTQKLEDEWLRYFKENCKNPKMVRAFLLCWLICSLFTHYTNWSKIFKCQEIFRIKIAFCRWEKWAWQSRRFTLCRFETRMIKTLTMTSPFLQNLMLYKMILNFLLLLWFLDMFGPRHIKIWKKETLCNTAFHLKVEA